MTDEPDFTMGDLLQQLAEEFGYSIEDSSGLGVYTSTELSELTGISRYRVIKWLKRKHRDDEIEITRKKVACFGGGREMLVSAYRLKKGEEDVGEN